jgi:hypothetical protein
MPTLEERVAHIEKHGSLPARHIRTRQLLAYALVCIVGIVGFWQNNNRITENEKARTVLCAQQENLEAKVARTQQFLDHPDLFPTFNDPLVLKLINAGQQTDEATLVTYEDLSCQD